MDILKPFSFERIWCKNSECILHIISLSMVWYIVDVYYCRRHVRSQFFFLKWNIWEAEDPFCTPFNLIDVLQKPLRYLRDLICDFLSCETVSQTSLWATDLLIVASKGSFSFHTGCHSVTAWEKLCLSRGCAVCLGIIYPQYTLVLCLFYVFTFMLCSCLPQVLELSVGLFRSFWVRLRCVLMCNWCLTFFFYYYYLDIRKYNYTIITVMTALNTAYHKLVFVVLP